MVNFGNFAKPEFWVQTVLPDRSFLIRQKLVENAKSENLKWDTFDNFQTLCTLYKKAPLGTRENHPGSPR